MAKPLKFSVISYTAKQAIERWHTQYGFKPYKLADGRDASDISRALRELKRPTIAQVDKIIGDNGWTGVWCASCNDYKPKAASFGYDDPVEVCGDCLQAAILAVVGTGEVT